MKIYQLNNSLLKIENNELFCYSSETNNWICLNEIPIESGSIRFSLDNVNFEDGTFINKRNERVSFNSGPSDKIPWIKWFREQTGCRLQESRDVSEQFRSDWPQ